MSPSAHSSQSWSSTGSLPYVVPEALETVESFRIQNTTATAPTMNKTPARIPASTGPNLVRLLGSRRWFFRAAGGVRFSGSDGGVGEAEAELLETTVAVSTGCEVPISSKEVPHDAQKDSSPLCVPHSLQYMPPLLWGPMITMSQISLNPIPRARLSCNNKYIAGAMARRLN